MMLQIIGKPAEQKLDSPMTRVVDSILEAQAQHEGKAPAVIAGYVEIAQKRAAESNAALSEPVAEPAAEPIVDAAPQAEPGIANGSEPEPVSRPEESGGQAT